MKRWLMAVICVFGLVGCKRYEPALDMQESPVVEVTADETPESELADSDDESNTGSDEDGEKSTMAVIQITNSPSIPERKPVKVKGIYISGYVAGTKDMMDGILDKIEGTEINTVVIDVKNDEGHITFAMDSPMVTEVDSCKKYIGDIDGLIADLKARDLYVIARVVAFRDPYLAEQKPEWSLKTASGEMYRDKAGLAWVNPYRQEVWDYLVEIGTAAQKKGFDEVQFDYIRFSTEKSMEHVVFEEEDTKGRSKTGIITVFTDYAYNKLAPLGLFVSADVFGAIIGSEEDAVTVGQVYQDMAEELDYICPMIYPSHYGDGNFGLAHPDKQPYETIMAALTGSKEDLMEGSADGRKQAVVRPWLQDFTASYLKNHIKYGPEQVRAQIQAVYDAGYEEWILWNASCRYSWDSLLPTEPETEEPESVED